MKDAKEPILIILAILIIAGFFYKPVKEGAFNKSSKTRDTSSAIGKSEVNLGYTPNKIIAGDIKDVEKEIKNMQRDLLGKVREELHSPYYGKVKMSSSISGLRQSDPGKEYVRLTTSLKETETVKITGWYLKSQVTGYYAVIGGAALLPFPFTRTETNVVLQKGDRVILTKGFSPIGISFRSNICTGYFEENRKFTPGLPLQCPRPKDELLPVFSSVYDRNDECIKLIEKIPRCRTRNNEYIRDLPDTVTQSCKTYLTNQVNYNTCVAKHYGDTNFPGNEYRLFLNKFGPLWRTTHDTINLHDENGLIVDTIEY